MMKNLLGKLLVVLVLALGIASCAKDDDNSWYEEQKKQYELERKRIDSTLNAQKLFLAAYAAANFENPVLSDSTGIWFEILEPGDESSYTYKSVLPTITVKYKGQLADEDGTVFDDKTDDEDYPSGVTFTNWNNLISSWYYAFVPKTVTVDGTTYKTGGLTNTGLKKGSRIRFITPSPYGYDNKEVKNGDVTIPKDSPLVFEITVVDIE